MANRVFIATRKTQVHGVAIIDCLKRENTKVVTSNMLPSHATFFQVCVVALSSTEAATLALHLHTAKKLTHTLKNRDCFISLAGHRTFFLHNLLTNRLEVAELTLGNVLSLDGIRLASAGQEVCKRSYEKSSVG